MQQMPCSPLSPRGSSEARLPEDFLTDTRASCLFYCPSVSQGPLGGWPDIELPHRYLGWIRECPTIAVKAVERPAITTPVA